MPAPAAAWRPASRARARCSSRAVSHVAARAAERSPAASCSWQQRATQERRAGATIDSCLCSLLGHLCAHCAAPERTLGASACAAKWLCCAPHGRPNDMPASLAACTQEAQPTGLGPADVQHTDKRHATAACLPPAAPGLAAPLACDDACRPARMHSSGPALRPAACGAPRRPAARRLGLALSYV